MLSLFCWKIWRGRVILLHIYSYNIYLNVVNHAISTEIFQENRPLQRRKNKIPPCSEFTNITNIVDFLYFHSFLFRNIEMTVLGQKMPFSLKGLNERFPFWSFLYQEPQEIPGRLVPASRFKFCVKIHEARCAYIKQIFVLIGFWNY